MITDKQAASYFAANLLRLLKSRELSIRALARMTGDSPMRISNATRAQHVTDIACAARIAEALDVSLDALLRQPAENLSHAS